MNPALPVIDDTQIWDTMLSLYKVPAITVALELEIFETLQQPASVEELVARSNLSLRGTKALLAMLKSLEFLDRHQGRYQLNNLSRTYMLKDSPYNWANFFAFSRERMPMYDTLLKSVSQGDDLQGLSAEGWESGQMDPALGRLLTDYMHCHSMAAAVGLSNSCDFSKVKKLLDIGGGSGCYASAIANQNPQLHGTIMELAPICTVAQEYIKRAGVADRIDTRAVDMFRQAWPQGYDAHFFANVFHDWLLDTCEELCVKSFQALEPGGKIYLQEMLLNEDGDSPAQAVAFSFLMGIGTKGQQFTLNQLADMLGKAGFINVKAQRSYGYYSLVSAEKPTN